MKQTTTLRNVVALCAMTLVLLLHAGVVNAQDNTPIGYAVLSEDSTTLTFMYGTPTGDYFPTEYNSYPGWNEYNYNHPVLSKITSIVFDSSFANARPSKCSYWFYGLRANTTIEGIENLNTSNVKSMRAMFYHCGITSFDLSHFDTSNVTDMAWMFAESKIKNPDVSLFNTSKVRTMENMFMDNNVTTSLDVSNWDTSNVTTMALMFAQNNNSTKMSLASLDVSNWNTSRVTTMENMFHGCPNLTSLDVSNWNTSKVVNFKCVFYDCSGLKSIDVSNWNTSQATSFQSIFYNCSGLTSIDVSKWDTSKATMMSSIFSGCSGLTSITFGENFSTEKATGTRSKRNMFYQCSNLRYINSFASNHTDAIKYSGNMMSGIPKTTVIYLPHGSQLVTDKQNVVYSYNGDETDLRCPKYYSEDKVDIELPHDFTTNTAEYTRTMGTEYGSVILPYDFTTNSNIQAYTLDEEHKTYMYFKDTETVPAHTPFAFKKLGNADFTMTDETGGFGITVNATHTTSAAEGGEPYTHSENLSGWTTKGYYVNETVEDYDGAFYIAGDKFYKADGALTMYPHRVTFHGTWTESTGTKSINVLDDVTDAIDAAEARMVEQNEIYDAQGRQLNTLTRGLNIIRMSDGTTRKIIRK